MKHLTIILFIISLGLGVGCNSSGETAESKSSCQSKCSSVALESTDSLSQFDAGMSRVCQQACGVKEYDEADIVSAVDAEVGQITKCPVSGAVYVVKTSSPNLEYNGKSFHSCCPTCASIFEDAPDKFVKNL